MRGLIPSSRAKSPIVSGPSTGREVLLDLFVDVHARASFRVGTS
jgi:hypothetical protein